MGATHRKLRPRVVLHQQSARQAQVRLRSMSALTPARAKIDPPATSGHRLMPTDAITAGRLHSGSVMSVKQVPTTSNHGVDEGGAAPVKGSIALLASLRAADGLLEDPSSNDLQLLMLVLAQSTQPGHRLARGATCPTH